MDNGVCKSTMSAVKAVHGGLFNVLGDDEGTKQNKESNAGWMKGEGREKQSTRNGPVFAAPEPRCASTTVASSTASDCQLRLDR